MMFFALLLNRPMDLMNGVRPDDSERQHGRRRVGNPE